MSTQMFAIVKRCGCRTVERYMRDAEGQKHYLGVGLEQCEACGSAPRLLAALQRLAAKIAQDRDVYLSIIQGALPQLCAHTRSGESI